MAYTQDELVALATNIRSLKSEVKEINGVRLSWKEVKQNYLNHIEQSSEGALLIAIADKIDNIESKLEEFEKDGESIHGRWKQPKESYLWFYDEALRIAQARLPKHPLTARFAEAHTRQKEVFTH